MAIYRPKGSKVWVLDFMFKSQRIRESTGMTSKTRAKEVFEKRKQSLRDGSAGIRRQARPDLLSTAAAEWQQAKQLKWSPKMASIVRYSIGHLLPVLGKKPCEGFLGQLGGVVGIARETVGKPIQPFVKGVDRIFKISLDHNREFGLNCLFEKGFNFRFKLVLFGQTKMSLHNASLAVNHQRDWNSVKAPKGLLYFVVCHQHRVVHPKFLDEGFDHIGPALVN